MPPKQQMGASVWISSFPGVTMSRYSIARGRKKEVRKFTPRHGLWVLALLMLLEVIMLLLMIFGVLRIDVD